MTTKELCAWVIEAQDIHGASFNKITKYYKKLYEESLTECRPANATDVDMQLASAIIYRFWNDVQDWHAEFNKNK